MPNQQKGGRNNRAPYSTTHCRIPQPIKSTVEQLSAAYKILIGSDDENGCNNLIKSTQDAIANLGESEQEINRLKLELALTKTKIEALESEREFAIKNLLTAFDLGSRDGTKIKAAIAVAFPEIQERLKLLGKKQIRLKE